MYPDSYSMYPDDGNIVDIVVAALETEIKADTEIVEIIVEALETEIRDEIDFVAAGVIGTQVADDAYSYYHIRLYDNDICETEDITYRYEPGYDEDMILWYWNEGNGACDCNRALEFYRKRGKTDPNRTCGHTRISLLGIWRAADGAQIAESEV